MPATPNSPLRARQQMQFPNNNSGAHRNSNASSPHHHPGAGAPISSHFSSRIVVIGSENCTSAILGSQVLDNQISVTGRLRQWTEASQALGCGEIQLNERLVNCPTSKRSMKQSAKNNNSNDASKSTLAANNTNNNNTAASSRNITSTKFDGDKNANNNNNSTEAKQQQQQQQSSSSVAQLIHAKSTTLTQILPGLTLELFEINETDVPTLTHDHLFGPYVLPANTVAVTLVLDCASLFPAPPNCSLLIESVESVIQTVERKKRELAQKRLREAGMVNSGFGIIGSGGIASANDEDMLAEALGTKGTTAAKASSSASSSPKAVEDPNKIVIPTLVEVLETYRQRQDASAEQYIMYTTERIQALRSALDTWAGEGAGLVPIHVALHNTEIVAPRLEAWSLTTNWAKISDASRAKVLSKLPSKQRGEGEGGSASTGDDKTTSRLLPHNTSTGSSLPSLQSCCAPEPFVQSHLSLHRTHPQISGTVRAIRGVLNTISNRVNGTLFFPMLTSVLDQTPIALLSSIVARPQVLPNNNHLQEIIHSFKTRCLFRRVFVIEPRSLLMFASDKPFFKYVAGLARSSGEKESLASLLAQHNSPIARGTPGIETSFSQTQSFIQDYLAVADAMKLSTSLAPIVCEDFSNETTLIKAAFAKEEQGDILNVSEGGLASWRGSLELTHGEGVYLYGLAPPVNLVLGCIGDCQEVQRTQSLIEFNLHIIQQTISGLFEETMKRARAAGYTA